jgi:phosphoribosylformimino-5-aminoimidazole carboxamide ribotide isomerase
MPVLDVIGGQVVRGIGGERQYYRPIASILTDSMEPVKVANALLGASGASELYVADLDAIRWGISDFAFDRFLEQVDATVFIERGGPGLVTTPPRVRQICSLETRLSFDEHRHHARTPGAVFSIDLKNGKLIDGWKEWGLPSAAGAIGLVRMVFALGFRSLIVLDLVRVGTGTGSGTEALLKSIREEFPNVELIAGGGVKTWEDVDRLGAAGADAVLVASALHDGALTFPRPVS